MQETMTAIAPRSKSQPFDTDILCVGAGAAGLIAAIALARAGHRLTIVGRKPAPLPGRTVALFDGSLDLLERFGLLEDIERLGAPVRGMRIIDDMGSIFRASEALYEAGEIGLDKFGVNVSNDDIVCALDKVAARIPNLRWVEAFASMYDFRDDGVVVALDDDTEITAKLVIAGDGRNSLARKTAGVSIREWTYPQTALTMFLRHRRPHDDITTEYHTRSGPFTFVPLPPGRDAPHRSSLVWLVGPDEAERLKAMPREELGLNIADQSHHRFGVIEVEGEIGAFPMGIARPSRTSAPRLMLVGEASHVFPPLAAQGLNLGIRDSAGAAAALEGVDLDDPSQIKSAIERFEAERRADIDLRTGVVHILNRALLTRFLPIDFARALGMSAAAHIGPLRRAVLSEGVAPKFFSKLAPFTRLAGRLSR